MSTVIKLVQNDTRPSLVVNFIDKSSGEVINITGCIIRMKFRQVGETTLTATLTGSVLDGNTGLGVFHWSSSPGVLSGEAGMYEGELEIFFPDGTSQSAFDVLKFKMREEF